MKNAILTVDVEEWYQLEYLDSEETDRKNTKMVPAILNLLDLLDQHNIKATFFILADIADEYLDIITEISDRGHEIGCHGMDHDLLHDISAEDFLNKAGTAREKLEKLLGSNVVKGYRASCFSMDRNKLDVLQDIGYTYDSSFIRFANHPLYGEIDMSGYNREQSLVYSRNGFYEFEIPTLKILKYNIPISGGGYLRLFPLFLIKILFRLYWRKDENLLFYIHPFELTDIKIPFTPKTGFIKKFRASVGRKRNCRKLEKMIKWLKAKEVRFATPSEFIRNNSKEA